MGDICEDRCAALHHPVGHGARQVDRLVVQILLSGQAGTTAEAMRSRRLVTPSPVVSGEWGNTNAMQPTSA
jgi:hypothetical protein